MATSWRFRSPILRPKQGTYQLKLQILYGFNAPTHEALGYGKSLHDALAEVHARAIHGDVADAAEVPLLVETHLRVPYDARRSASSSRRRPSRFFVIT